MAFLKLENVSKSFASNKFISTILHNVSLSIEKGEVVAIRGDNGSGKTTLINIIAGIENQTSGNLTFENGKPKIGLVPQDYTSSLLPYMNAYENIAMPLKLKGEDSTVSKHKVSELINKLGFQTLPLEKYPHQLSGGQKQKVAICRALVFDPDILILDEPFSNIDTHTQIELQQEINKIHNEKKLTTIFISHELDHCIYLADRIIFLNGKPSEIKTMLKVSLPRPRTRQQVFSDEFGRIRVAILKKEDEIYVSYNHS